MESKEIKDERKKIISDIVKTELAKEKFIGDIKNGLGEQLKQNPNKIKIIKKTRKEKIIEYLKKIFNKF